MERITPLAKILAEANGIEWENLSGTGDGGSITEQDILNYLSRIMSGEEEPPSTPVDAPPPDWTGEDIPGGGMFNADMLKGAGVDADIAAFVEQTRPAASAASDTPDVPAPTVPAQPVPAQPSPAAQVPTSFAPATLGDDEFELEDAPAAAAATPVIPAPAPAAGLGNLLSRLYKGGDSSEAATPEAGVPAAPEVRTPEVPAPEVRVTEVRKPEIRVPEVAAPSPSSVPVSPAPTPAQPVAAPPVPVQATVQATPQPAPAMPAAVSAPAMPPRPASAPENATWLGVYLRRDTDVKAAQSLARQLGEALEQDVSLALLVARAAQRHADLLGLESVALDSGQEQRQSSVRQGHLREVLSGLSSAFEGTPDLLVVDAGAYGLDDLHYPQTLTLSVGREQEGRVSLSLNGNADAAQAAAFLARVAETLEKPIVLVL